MLLPSARVIVSRFLESSGESGQLPSNHRKTVSEERWSNKLFRLLQGVPPQRITAFEAAGRGRGGSARVVLHYFSSCMSNPKSCVCVHVLP